MSSDNQTLDIKLKSQLSAQKAVEILKQQSAGGYWDDATTTVKDDQTLELHLTQPWAGFITELVTPIFPFGPYRAVVNSVKAKKNTDILYFETNPSALAKPLIPNVELHLYSDTASLQRAMRKNGLDGALLTDDNSLQLPNGWSKTTVGLAGRDLVFLNLRQASLATKDVRAQIVQGKTLKDHLELHLATAATPKMKALAQTLADKLASQNIQVDIETHPLLELVNTVVPARQYDLLLLGVDEGPDSDLFPYWHSSQISAPGQNFAGYRNKEVDKILDDARSQQDAGKRHADYDQAWKIVTDDATVMDLGTGSLELARSSRVHGDLPNPVRSNADRWRSIAAWYMRQKRAH